MVVDGNPQRLLSPRQLKEPHVFLAGCSYLVQDADRIAVRTTDEGSMTRPQRT